MKNRNGSYKKNLLTEEQMHAHENFIYTCLKDLVSKDLSPCELCTLYLLLFLRIRHPKNWLQKNSHHPILSTQSPFQNKKLLQLIPESFQLNEWEKEKLADLDIETLFSQYNLKGIPLAASQAMYKWSIGKYPIVLLDYIPSSRELLKMQSLGKRCITIILNESEITKLVLNSRDPMSFIVHDLEHAEQFFANKNSIQGQLGFYKMINLVMDKEELKTRLKIDRTLKDEFHYVVSDMNAYVIHLLKCFKSAIVKHDHSFQFNLLDHFLLWWKVPSAVYHSIELLNTPEFTNEDENILVQYFESKSQEAYL